MKRTTFLLILTLVICVIIASSFYYTCSFDEAIDISTSLISSLTGIVTVLIAFILIDKFDFEKKTANFQLDSVIKLIKALSTCICKVSGDDYLYQIPFNDDLSIQKEMMNRNNDASKRIIFLVSDEDNAFQEINKLLNDFWLPDIIKTNLKFLEYFGYDEIPDEKKIQQNTLTAHFGCNKLPRQLLIQTSTFQEYITNVENLNQIIRNWWSNYSNIKLQRNLKPK
jgi:hypothetical protein